jgi:microcystin-dependent protein
MSLNLPVTILNGTAADATLVMQNFNTVKNYINANMVSAAGGTITGVLELTNAPTADQHAARKGYVDDIIPIGTIFPFDGTEADLIAQAKHYDHGGSWSLADGRALNRDTFTRYFSQVGTRHGGGNGETTFNIVDLRGRHPFGLDAGDATMDTLGEKGGSKNAVVVTHTHPAVTGGPSTNTSGTPSTNTSGTPSNNTSDGPSTANTGQPSSDTTGAVASGSALLSHQHGAGTLAIATGGSHSHTIVGQMSTVNLSPGGTGYGLFVNGGSTTTSTATAHGHSISGNVGQPNNSGGVAHTHSLSAHTHSMQSHTHTLGNHTHTLANHTHTLSNHTHTVTVDAFGESAAGKNMEPFVTVHWIVKVK